MTFKNIHHQNILKVLKALNSNLLEMNFAYFGGGTVIALDNQEYRCSKDIDFLCAVTSQGYKNLRSFVYEHGVQSLFDHNSHIQVKNPKTDQYGIRFIACTPQFKNYLCLNLLVSTLINSSTLLAIKYSSIPALKRKTYQIQPFHHDKKA